MEKPDLDKMWRTWIKIGPKNQLTLKMLQDTIRHQLNKISKLHETGEVCGYYFLLHNKHEDQSNAYFDVIFTTDKEDPNTFLPRCCIDTKKIPPDKKISDIDVTLLVNGDSTEGWRIVGEQSEFIIKLVCAHKENMEIPSDQIVKFMHFFMNPLGLGCQSIFFGSDINNAWELSKQFFPRATKF